MARNDAGKLTRLGIGSARDGRQPDGQLGGVRRTTAPPDGQSSLHRRFVDRRRDLQARPATSRPCLREWHRGKAAVRLVAGHQFELQHGARQGRLAVHPPERCDRQWKTISKSPIQKATAYEDSQHPYGNGTKAPFTKMTRASRAVRTRSTPSGASSCASSGTARTAAFWATPRRVSGTTRRRSAASRPQVDSGGCINKISPF